MTVQNRRAVFASSLVLILANLLPLLAVWKLDWKIYDLLVLYWVEIILIGVINLVRMILIAPSGTTMGVHLWKLFFVPFFATHFGFFCVGIGLAIQVLFGKENFQVGDQISAMLNGDTRQLFWALAVSHLFSFFWNYVGQKEFRNTTVVRRMFQPYLRVIPLVLLTIGGAFLIIKLDLPIWSLYAYIGGKLLVDLIIHGVMHFRMMTYQPET